MGRLRVLIMYKKIETDLSVSDNGFGDGYVIDIMISSPKSSYGNMPFTKEEAEAQK